MSESIEAPKKRTYTRKPKFVALSEVLSSDSEQSTTSTVSDLSLTPPEPIPQKPKRNYKKKVTIDLVEIPSPPVLERQSNNIREDTELIDSEPETEPVKPVKEKKPRTEKQKEAFEKMRQARLSKTEELKRLREIERDQKKLEKEEIKLETLNDKILEKASSIKQRKSKKPTTEKFDVLPEPQYVQQIPEKKHREILFV
jgi:hypothetical protein